MTAKATLTLTVRVAWWVRPYIQSVALFTTLTGMTPDLEKAQRTMLRGIKVSL